MKKQKIEKMVKVYILCPNDMEKPVLYFANREDALKFSESYKDGAFVSKEAEEVPERIVNQKSLHIAKRGHVL